MSELLGARLMAVARLVPEGHAVADVGTDHGLVPLWLLRQSRVSRMIACDRREAPLDGARARLAETQAEIRLGDGLGVLVPGEVQTVILAGMGGRRMIQIFEEGQDVWSGLECLVLQPQRETPSLRRWLVKRGWHLVEESVVLDRGRFYTVMAWKPGAVARVWSDLEFQFGPMILAHGGPVARSWLLDELRHARENLDQMDLRSPGNSRRVELCSSIDRLAEALERVGSQ